jgi:hypothetical protein
LRIICGLSRSAAACRAAHVVDGEERVVALTEADVSAIQFLLDEGVAVDPVSGVKGKEGGYA